MDDEDTQPRFDPVPDPDGHAGPPVPPPSNGSGPERARPAAPRPQVRSGLAQKRNPALATAGAFALGVRRFFFRDKLALFLALASVALAVTFFILLGSIGPSSHGAELPISRVITLAEHKQISTATLLDHDDRVEIALKTPGSGTAATGTTNSKTATTGTAAGGTAAANPSSTAGTNTTSPNAALAGPGAARILGRLPRLGRADPEPVADAQPLRRARDRRSAVGQGAAPDRRAVPDPDPAAGMPVRVLHADQRRGRRRRDRRVLGVHRQRPQEGQGQNRSDHVRRRRRRGRGRGRAQGDPRLPERPLALSQRRRRRAEGSAARRPSGHR